MKERMQEVVDANWGWFYRKGQVMGFSQEVGRWISEVTQLVSLVGEIFHELAQKDYEEENQNRFIQIISRAIFTRESMGDR